MARGQQATQVGVAMARELGGCMGPIATQVTVPPSSRLPQMMAPFPIRVFD
jgi:hypothetical protein